MKVTNLPAFLVTSGVSIIVTLQLTMPANAQFQFFGRRLATDNDNQSTSANAQRQLIRRHRATIDDAHVESTTQRELFQDFDLSLSMPIEEVGNNGSPQRFFPLEECRGDCDNDWECKGSLICHQREPYDEVPGCDGGRTFDGQADFCIRSPDALSAAEMPASLDDDIPVNDVADVKEIKQLATSTYTIYYGYLHSHTGLSDGSGTPNDAYSQAKEVGMDFFGTSDHDYYPHDMSIKNWKEINSVANHYDEDGVFTALAGFEWTSDGIEYQHLGRNHGHFTVVGTPTWCNAGHEDCDTLDEFVQWLDSQPTGLAIFNHPGQYGSDSFEHFNLPKTPHIIGMELWNREMDYYSRKGNNGVRYYDEALQKGWYIGAGGGQDNHGWDWGKKNEARMAVLAKTLSRESIMEALKERRYYSTLIDGVAVSFQCDKQDMGSIIKSDVGGVHSCTFDVSSNHKFTWIELIQNGEPYASIENPTFPFETILPALTDDGYVYAVLYQGSKWKVVTSPIFFKIETEPL